MKYDVSLYENASRKGLRNLYSICANHIVQVEKRGLMAVKMPLLYKFILDFRLSLQNMSNV